MLPVTCDKSVNQSESSDVLVTSEFIVVCESVSLRDSTAKTMLGVYNRVKFQSETNVESICRALNFGEAEVEDAGDGDSKNGKNAPPGGEVTKPAEVKQEHEAEAEAESQAKAEAESIKKPVKKMMAVPEVDTASEESLRGYLANVSDEGVVAFCAEVKMNEHFSAYKRFLLQEGVDEPDAFGSELSDPLEDLVHWGLWIAKQKPEAAKNCPPFQQTETEKARSTGRP